MSDIVVRLMEYAALETNSLAGAAMREAAREIETLRAELGRYSMTAGMADQYAGEAKAARKSLGFSEDSDEVSPSDIAREIGILKSKNKTSLANNLCPDHRDKQVGKPCLACEIESRASEIERLREQVAGLERERDELRGDARMYRGIHELWQTKTDWVQREFSKGALKQLHPRVVLGGHRADMLRVMLNDLRDRLGIGPIPADTNEKGA